MSGPDDFDQSEEIRRLADHTTKILELQEELDRAEWIKLARRMTEMERRETESVARVRNCLTAAEEAVAEARRALEGMERDHAALREEVQRKLDGTKEGT